MNTLDYDIAMQRLLECNEIETLACIRMNTSAENIVNGKLAAKVNIARIAAYDNLFQRKYNNLINDDYDMSLYHHYIEEHKQELK